MKNVKRALAMCLTLVLLLSCSPVFNVSATGTESESDAPSAYEQLMRNYILDNSKSAVGISDNNPYITKDENGYLTFGNVTEVETASGYASLQHGQDGKKLIFEAEFRCDTPGFVISFQANKNSLGETVEIMSLSGKKLSFSGSDVKVTFESYRWYKITFAYDLESHTYDAFVDGEQKVDDGTTLKQLDTLTRIRAIISSKTTAGGNFQIRNVNWYRESAYRQLMDNYKLVVSTDFSDPDNTLLTKNQETDKIFIDEDEYLKFLNTTAGKFVNVNHYLGTPSGKIIFEADVCWNTEGLRIGFLSISDQKALMEFDNGTFKFASTSDTMPMTAGQWYKISCAINLDDNVYDAFVDEVQVVSGAEISADVQLKGIRLYVHKNSSENADGDFLVDNVKWYVYHDEHVDDNQDHACDVEGCSKFMGEHKDADTDHICDYGCAVPFGTCEDTDKDHACDYCAGDYHAYTVVDGEIVCEGCGIEVEDEITASGVLNLNGQSRTIKVTGKNIVLSVVDTSLIPENGADLSGKNAGKLTLADGSTGKIADWTQYGNYKYLKVENKNENGEPDGTYSFHPFNLVFTRVGLNTIGKDGIPAVCIQVTFIANDVVRDLLMAEGNDYGIKKAGSTVESDYALCMTGTNDDYKFTADKNGVRAYFDLGGSLLDDNFEKTVSYQAVMKIGDMEIVSNQVLEVNPHSIMAQLNANDAIIPTPEQKARIQALWNGENTANYSKLQQVLTKFN